VALGRDSVAKGDAEIGITHQRDDAEQRLKGSVSYPTPFKNAIWFMRRQSGGRGMPMQRALKEFDSAAAASAIRKAGLEPVAIEDERC
jgi:hypothetical protein